ncbi:3683_t:CDS:10, partial [Ambispora gerdemannii]
FDGWETVLNPDKFNLISIIKFRRVKDDFTYNKSAEHTEISKFVSYIAETATGEKWKKAASALHKYGMLNRRNWAQPPKRPSNVRLVMGTSPVENHLLEVKLKQAKAQFAVDLSIMGNEAHMITNQTKLDFISNPSIDPENVRKRSSELIVDDDTINSVVPNTGKKIKTTQDPSMSVPSASTNDETEESSDPDEQLEINLTRSRSMEGWKHKRYAEISSVSTKVRSKITFLLNLSFAIILQGIGVDHCSCPCLYPDFTETEWYTITRTKPFVIEQPIILSSISTTFQEAARKHLMDEDSYIYADNSELGRAAACTFNELRNLPPLAPSKMSEALHCCNLLYPHVHPIFNQPLREYEVRLNRVVKGTKKRHDLSCVVDEIPVLNSEFKPLGCTPLQKKKDFVKVHLRTKESINQQFNLKGGPGESGLFYKHGADYLDSELAVWYVGISSRASHVHVGVGAQLTRRIAIQLFKEASMPLIESTFCHFVTLEERVNKLAKDFKRRKQPFTPPQQMKFMNEFPNSPQLRQLFG